MHPLDNPAWSALTTVHQRFAETRGAARRYPTAMAPFCGVEALDAEAWSALASFAEPVAIARSDIDSVPAGGRVIVRRSVQQFLAPRFEPAESSTDIRALTVDDVPAMLDLTDRTQPGPFAARTIDFGGYVGIFEGQQLVAMAGRRMALPGYCEISAVCTDEQHRGRGYGARLTRAVTEGIQADGDDAFLHVLTDNQPALGVYQGLGFAARARIDVVVVQLTP